VIISLSSINQLLVIMETRCVFFAVRTECSNVFRLGAGFRELRMYCVVLWAVTSNGVRFSTYICFPTLHSGPELGKNHNFVPFCLDYGPL
jgi:hypothetical protein